MIMLLGLIFILIGSFLIIGILADNGYDNMTLLRAVSGILCAFSVIVIGSGLIIESMKDPEPKAIDVYRDRTELQINYKSIKNDTIPTDSIVIWKK